MSLKIIYRDEWKASLPRSHIGMKLPAEYVLSMSTNSDPCYNESLCKFTCRHLQKFHMNMKKMHDIRYSFMIGGDGSVYEGRGWQFRPLLPKMYENVDGRTILIGFMGRLTEEELPIKMLKAREDLVKYGIENKYIKEDCKKWDISQPAPKKELEASTPAPPTP